MPDFRGTPQDLKYIWQGRKPLRLPGGRLIHRGDALTPTVEMVTGLGDLMTPVGEGLRTEAAPAQLEPVLPLERDGRGRFRREGAE